MIGHLLKPELEELIHGKRWDVLREALSHFHPSDIAEILTEIPEADEGRSEARPVGAVKWLPCSSTCESP